MTEREEALQGIDKRLQYTEEAMKKLIVTNPDGTNRVMLGAEETANLIVQSGMNQLVIMRALRVLLERS